MDPYFFSWLTFVPCHKGWGNRSLTAVGFLGRFQVAKKMALGSEKA